MYDKRNETTFICAFRFKPKIYVMMEKHIGRKLKVKVPALSVWNSCLLKWSCDISLQVLFVLLLVFFQDVNKLQ